MNDEIAAEQVETVVDVEIVEVLMAVELCDVVTVDVEYISHSVDVEAT